MGLGGFLPAGGVPVGIVDTGIDASHEDLAGKVRACGAAQDGVVTDGDCADGEGHGTHVAGHDRRAGEQPRGCRGVAFAAPLIVCRALGAPDGSGSVADVAACIRWAHDRGAKVISMSLGGPSSRTLAEAAKSAYARGGRSGSLLVAAAGNDGERPRSSTRAGWTRSSRSRRRRARRGRAVLQPQCGRRGRGAGRRHPLDPARRRLLCACPGRRWRRRTSRAPRRCSWGLTPSATAATIRRRLDKRVDDRGAPGRDAAYGYGVVDLATS
jgi:hypothetical protein